MKHFNLFTHSIMAMCITMKRYVTDSILALCVMFGLYACGDTDLVDCSSSISAVENQLMEHVLLEKVYQQGDEWIFCFENSQLNIPAESVEHVQVDTERWTTSVVFVNGTSLVIPTLGDDLSALVTSVTVNPSTYNPLAAEVVINLPEQGKMSLTVHSKEGKLCPDVSYNFKSVESSQVLPVLGLYPDYKNRVTLVYSDKKGKERARTDLEIQTGPLQGFYMPKTIRVTKLKADKMEPGMTLVNSQGASMTDTSVPYMLDCDGEVRWVLNWNKHKQLKNIRIDCGLNRMPNGHYVTGDGNNHQMAEVDILGNLIHSWNLKDYGYTFHHAAQATAEGNVVLNVSKMNARIASGADVRFHDVIIEFNPNKSEVIKEWDLVHMLDSSRYNLLGDADPSFIFSHTASNWIHNNGVEKVGNEYLATGRYQGIFKYKANGSVKWIISPHKAWKPEFKSILLQPLHADGTPITDPEIINGTKMCDDFDWPWGPHCAVMMPNGHYMVFDNGYGRHFQLHPTEEFTRAVEYEVDEKQHTVRQVWQYGRERGREFYTLALSSVGYMPTTGNRLIGAGVMNIFSDGKGGARIVEVDPRTQEVVYEVELEDGTFHRVYRMSLYPEGL